jgi:hypothetical protein
MSAPQRSWPQALFTRQTDTRGHRHRDRLGIGHTIARKHLSAIVGLRDGERVLGMIAIDSEVTRGLDAGFVVFHERNGFLGDNGDELVVAVVTSHLNTFVCRCQPAVRHGTIAEPRLWKKRRPTTATHTGPQHRSFIKDKWLGGSGVGFGHIVFVDQGGQSSTNYGGRWVGAGADGGVHCFTAGKAGMLE